MQLLDLITRAKEYLCGRTGAYYRRLHPSTGIDAQVIMADLGRFCRGYASTFSPDSHIAARLDGRREVFLRIASHLNLSDAELWRLYGETNQPSQRNPDA